MYYCSVGPRCSWILVVYQQPTKQPRCAPGDRPNYPFVQAGSSAETVLPFNSACVTYLWKLSWAVSGAEVFGKHPGWSIKLEMAWGGEGGGGRGEQWWAFITRYSSPMDSAVCDPRASFEMGQLHVFGSDYWEICQIVRIMQNNKSKIADRRETVDIALRSSSRIQGGKHQCKTT